MWYAVAYSDAICVRHWLKLMHKLVVKVNKQKNSDTENVIYNQYGEGLAIFNTENIKISGSITKLEATKCNLFVFSSTSAENLNF